MSLLTTVQSAVQTAKDATVSLWQSITYKDQSSATYNTSTGAVTQTATDYSVKALITKYDQEDIADHILATDLKAMLLVDELTPTPSNDDTVVYNSVEYSIVDFQQDVSQSLWYLQLR